MKEKTAAELFGACTKADLLILLDLCAKQLPFRSIKLFRNIRRDFYYRKIQECCEAIDKLIKQAQRHTSNHEHGEWLKRHEEIDRLNKRYVEFDVLWQAALKEE